MSAISSSTGCSHRVARGKDELTLQPREFRLLEYLMKHAGQVRSRLGRVLAIRERRSTPTARPDAAEAHGCKPSVQRYTYTGTVVAG